MCLIIVIQLKAHVEPIKEKIKILESQILVMQTDVSLEEFNLPSKAEIEIFAMENELILDNLNFEVKRGIIGTVIDRIVGTIEELRIYGHIPIAIKSPYHVKYKTIDRHRRSPKRR
jgi:hypothetical protein